MRCFEEVWAFSQNVQGWFTINEARCAYELACKMPSHLGIIEIGSFRGRSTSVFGASGKMVFAVDPHDPTLGPFPNVTNDDTQSLMSVLRVFPNVQWLRMKSSDIVPSAFRCQIGLLLVDGCHVHPFPRNDFERLIPILHSNATILFHDFKHPVWPDVERDIAELVREGKLDAKYVVDQLCVAKMKNQGINTYDANF